MHLRRGPLTRLAAWSILSSVSVTSAIAERPITIEDIIGIRKIGTMAIAPDGQSVAYLIVQAIKARDAYSVTLVVTSAQDITRHYDILKREVPAARSEVGDVREDIGSNVTAGIIFTWTNGGQDLIYSVQEGERAALFQYSPSNGGSKSLWQTEGEITTIVATGKSKLGYCVRRLPGKSNDADSNDPSYRYDQNTFHPWDKHPWQDGRPYNNQSDRPWLAPDEPINCFERNGDTGALSKIEATQLSTPDLEKPFQGDGMAQFGSRAYQGDSAIAAWPSPDGKHILFAASIRQNEDANWVSKTAYWIEGKEQGAPQAKLFEIIGQREGGIHRVLWSPDSRSVLGIRESLDHTEIVKFDIVSGKETSLLKTDWGFEEATSSPDGRYLYVIRVKPDVPHQLARLDLLNGQMLLIDDVNQQFKGVQVPPFTVVRKSNQFGDELTGYLFYPPGFHGQERLPFVAIRGQKWDGLCDGGTGVEFPGMVLALRGYVVLFFEPSSKHFPPSVGGNGGFSDLRFQSPLESLRSLIADLDQKGWVDSKKTAIAGLSAGADIVDYDAGFSHVFSVGSATTGETYSPANYFIFNSVQVDGLFTQRYGLPYPDVSGMPAWQKVSTSLNASHSNMPLLFQPPDAEAMMTVPQHIAWKHAGLPVETYVYPDEGHLKVHPINRYYVMTRNVQWFDFWLRGIEDSRPEFTDQFKRWRRMRDDWNAKRSHHDSQPNVDKSIQ